MQMGLQEVDLIRLRIIIPALLLFSLTLSACSQGSLETQPETDVATETVYPVPEAVDTLADLAPLDEPLDEGPSEWSLRDRALAFKPELQALQEQYDHAVHQIALGDLLGAQEMIDQAVLSLAEASLDSVIPAGGLSGLYLGSLQNRLDRLQEILDEESLMHFSAPLEVADDSLVTLWYGGLPDAPARPLILERNDRVDHWIKYFTGRGRKTYELWLERGASYRPHIEAALERYELPMELYYLAMIESGFKTSALSSAGAVGPWQFIRGTARRYGLTVDYWVDERQDPVRSTEAACQYLAHLYGIFQDWNLAMAGYNSGEFRVQSSVRRAGSRDFWKLRLPRQTQDYVPKMMAAAWIGARLSEYGFTEPKAETVFRYEELRVDQAVDLSLIAKKGRFKRSRLKYLNPHLSRWCTPPDRPGYLVHVPPGSSGKLQTALADLSRDERVSFARHKVRRGETLYEIAKGYGTTVSAIIRRNNIRNPRLLRAGVNLIIPTHPDRGWRQPAPNGVAAAAAKVLPPLDVPANMVKGFYTVRRGDNLSVIARRLGVAVRKLQRWNGLGGATRIYPSQVLQYLYPGQSGTVAESDAKSATPTRHIHVVRKGENLSTISQRYGTTVKRLLTWNSGIGKESILHPGDRLVLYLGS
jgi:membrane-bound lytic murein transglycosylase D